ncbi:DUF4913 domain-containing protein [Nocardioides panzhihuensis]|uniref:DUF4913 domain-containing protein n=1 Tax=Nocardioides panzhihuensis TaxID=860243 RepID=A0A7Z0DJV4_9ACTN|nr:DUF4913 domain-containing protein [Nocardioides panzhihuensis]NYI76678.1 hypothetical protein [Nocardioides panzhihuensis]
MPEDRSESRLEELLDELVEDELRVATPPVLYYGNVEEFVSDRLVHLFSRAPESGLVWCPEWYRHAEALMRLDSIWRAWEHLRHDPATGISNWLLHHADPHMGVLMDPVAGPFAQCTNGVHGVTPPPLPHEPAPPGLFTDARGEWWASGTPLGLSDD